MSFWRKNGVSFAARSGLLLKSFEFLKLKKRTGEGLIHTFGIVTKE